MTTIILRMVVVLNVACITPCFTTYVYIYTIQVKGVQSDEDLRNIFLVPDLESLLLETGFCKPLSLLCMEDQSSIVSSITEYHCLIKVKAAMDDFMEGLASGGVLECIKRFSLMLRPLLCPEHSNITAGKIILQSVRMKIILVLICFHDRITQEYVQGGLCRSERCKTGSPGTDFCVLR